MRLSTSLMAARRVSFRERMPQSSYYQRGGFSPALLRARRKYLFPNLITGACLLTIVIGIYAYTIHAIGQDEFEDVPVPDGPAPAAGAPHASMNSSGGSTPVRR